MRQESEARLAREAEARVESETRLAQETAAREQSETRLATAEAEIARLRALVQGLTVGRTPARTTDD